MRRSRLIAALFVAAPLILVPFQLAGCPGTGSGGGGGGVGGVFNLPPTVIISVIPDPPRGVAPLTAEFDSSESTDDGVIVSREWDFGDGTTGTGIRPQHIFEENGVYAVRLTLTDEEGAASSRTVNVTVTDRPVAIIDVDRDTADAAPASFNFDGTRSFDPDAVEGDELTYRWQFGDGATETLATVTHTFATAGTFRVILSVTDEAGVVGTAEKLISVGIPTPSMIFRSPPPSLESFALPNGAPLWVQIDFEVAASVPYQISAGLDPDQDSANGNDIPLDLDATDGVITTDLPLTVPKALDLVGVTPGQYNLFVELRTDRSPAVREYSATTVYVLDPLTSTIGVDTPDFSALALDDARVIPQSTATRQIFSMGPLAVGDRLFVSLLTTPGYGPTYTGADFSVMILDANQELYAWFEDGLSLFSPTAKYYVTHFSGAYYVVLDGKNGAAPPAVSVSVERGALAAIPPRQQTIYLDFGGTGTNSIGIGGSLEFILPAFNAATLDAGLDTALLAENITQKFAAAVAPFNISVLASSRGDARPTEPHLTIYFDTSGAFYFASLGTLQFFGLYDFLDPRNESETGSAAIAVDRIYGDGFAMGALKDVNSVGTAVSNAALHHFGLMSGLRETQGDNTDVMIQMTAANLTIVSAPGLGFARADLAPLTGQDQIGIQDAVQLLSELYPN
jgi:PKD repeat protein/predicted small secreted protein